MTFTDVAKKFNRPNRPISRSAIARHAKHVLEPGPNGHRPRGGGPGPTLEGKSLTERVEALIARQESLADKAESTGQIIPAVAALREVRACLDQIGKLSGELSSANVNFYLMELTEQRIQDFLDAAALRGPQVSDYIRDQALKRFGHVLPAVNINFVKLANPGMAIRTPKQIEAKLDDS